MSCRRARGGDISLLQISKAVDGDVPRGRSAKWDTAADVSAVESDSGKKKKKAKGGNKAKASSRLIPGLTLSICAPTRDHRGAAAEVAAGDWAPPRYSMRNKQIWPCMHFFYFFRESRCFVSRAHAQGGGVSALARARVCVCRGGITASRKNRGVWYPPPRGVHPWRAGLCKT